MTNKKKSIFEILTLANDKEYSAYQNMTEAERRDIHPFVLMRWMSSGSAFHLMVMDEIVNPKVFALSQHKTLLWKLLCVGGTKSFTRFNWVKYNESSNTQPETFKILQQYLEIGVDEVKYVLSRYECDDILDMAMDLGYDSTTLNKIKKEFK